MMINGFDIAVNGMKIGESKKVKLQPTDAYGKFNEKLIHKIPNSQVPDELKPEVGSKLAITQENGTQVPVVVIDVNDEGIVLDANHELAG